MISCATIFVRCCFYYFYSQHGNTSSRTLSTRGMTARDLFRFFEIQSEEVTMSRAKMKEEDARERYGILCGDSSRFTQT